VHAVHIGNARIAPGQGRLRSVNEVLCLDDPSADSALPVDGRFTVGVSCRAVCFGAVVIGARFPARHCFACGAWLGLR